MNTSKRRKIFERLAQITPHPKTELHYDGPYQLLIAVLLSAQATDKSVNKATATLFHLAPTPQKMLELGEEQLIARIRHIGLYQSKAKHILQTSQKIMQEYDGRVPERYEDLIRLPGVGRKTALVLLNTYFNQPVIAVDTHVFRVANRTGLARGETVLAVDQKINRCVPQEFKKNAHHWLILHGRYICKAQRPRCEQCPIRDLCEHPNKNLG